MQAKDLRDDKKSRAAIRRLFPCMPIDSAETILKHGFQKGSGRVGRTTTLDEDSKVRLAVEAHIRHKFTPYEKLLRERKDDDLADDRLRKRARASIRPKVLEILAQWGSNPLLDVVASPASVIVAPAFEVATVVTRSTSPVVDGAVTRSYHTRQAARSADEKSVQTTALEDSIHARGLQWRIHKSNEDALLIAPTSTGTSSRTSVRAAEDIRSPRKVSSGTMTSAIAKDYIPTVPKAVSLEASMHASMSKGTLLRYESPSSIHQSSLGETSKTRLFKSSTHTNEATQEYSQASAKQLLFPAAGRGQILSALSGSPGASNRKRNGEDNKDSSSAKRPRHERAFSPEYPMEEALRKTDTEAPSAADSLPIHEAARLYADFDSMHLDDMFESICPTTIVAPKIDNLSAKTTCETDVAPNSHGGVPGSKLDTSITKRVVDLRHEVRSQLLRKEVRKLKQQGRTLPGQPEQRRLTQIKVLLSSRRATSLLDLQKWKQDFELFAQFTETQQFNVILAEFRAHLLEGRMDYNLVFVEHVRKEPRNIVGEPFSNHPKNRSATKHAKLVVDFMVGQARKDYSMIKADPYYENTLSAERSWAAWLVFEHGSKHGLRDVLQKRQLEKTGDKGFSNEKAFEILDDEEDDEGETLDDGVVSKNPSSLSERRVRRPGQDRLVNPFLLHPRRELGLDGANDFSPCPEANSSDKKNNVGIIG